ncbi:MAG: hypothetical protein U0270_25205 [Labilithrix sp.]
MRLSLALVGILAAPSLVACASGVDAPAPDTTSPATAVVEVERSTGPGDSTRNDAVAARVVRVKQGSVDESALSLAGVGAEVPAAGTCIVPSESAVVGRSVELLDVGQVSMTSESGKSLVLGPRLMPDPAGVVSGYFYSARSADAFVPGSKVALRSSGSPDLPDGFSISANAPRELVDLHVTPTADGLDLTWDATDSDAHDLVYADVLSPSPRVALRCVANDAGHLLIPSTIDEGQLSVHRLHKESFRAKGIEPGEIRFDVSKVLTFRR